MKIYSLACCIKDTTMKCFVFHMTMGLLLTSSTPFFAQSFPWIDAACDHEQFLQACDSVAIDDFAGDILDERNPMDDDMVQAIESRCRGEQFRGKKISIPKIIFALKVGQELITTAVKVAELYKESSYAKAPEDKE